MLDEPVPLTLDDPELEALDAVLTIPPPLDVDVPDEVGTVPLDVGVKDPVPETLTDVLELFE